jgi:ParB-like chromosome segregation protein Spo0J
VHVEQLTLERNTEPSTETAGVVDRSAVLRIALTDLSVGYSPRHTIVDHDHVAGLMEVLDRLPPVVVDKRTMVLIDGVHRLEAFRKAGRTHIDAVLFSGGHTEAVIIAIRANVRHGKPLTRSERRAAAHTLLARCPDRSDRWLAEICGLSHSTVARLRRTSPEAETPNGAPSRIGRDGRRRPLDPLIGRAEVARVIAEHPQGSIRETAGAARVAPSTARRIIAEVRQSPEGSRTVATPGGANNQLRPEAPVPVTGDPAFKSPDLAATVSWLETTAITTDDFTTYLNHVPLGRIYELADECRRRANTWRGIAERLESQARSPRSEVDPL